MQQGMIHLYMGDGKGKTTAALGLCLRACGRGKHVLWTSFLKSGRSGELNNPPFCVIYGQPVEQFWFTMTDEQKAEVRREHDARLAEAFSRADTENVDLLVLDEAVGAISVGALSEEKLKTLLAKRPYGLEVVLTGRDPSPELLQLADYVTEMRKIKHPFDRGVKARIGIEE